MSDDVQINEQGLLADTIYRFLHDYGDGGIWESFDSKNSRTVATALAEHLAAALPVLAADKDAEIERLKSEAREQMQRMVLHAADELAETREQLAGRDKTIAAVRAVLDAMPVYQHDEECNGNALNDDCDCLVRDLHNLRAALADPGQWEADPCTKVCQYAVDVGMEMYAPSLRCTEHEGYMRHCAEMDARADREREAKA